MAFTVTARQEFTNPSDLVNMSSFTTDSDTNTADALHLFFYSVVEASGASPALNAPSDAGAPTYTLVVKDGEGDNWYYDSFGIYMLAGGCWRATIPSSPSAFSLTVDGWSGANVGGGWAGSCDVTGHDTSSPIVQSKVNGSSLPGSGEQSGSVVLDAAPTSGNLLLVWTFAASDGSLVQPASPTAGVGKTMDGNLHVGHADSRLDYRVCDGTESATISCSDLGTNPGNYMMVAVEIAAAGGSPPPTYEGLYVPITRKPHLGSMRDFGRA